MDERPGETRAVIVGRTIPTLPGILVVALLATAVGLLAGWNLAGGSNSAPTLAVPRATPAATVAAAIPPPPSSTPLVRPAVVDAALRRAFVADRRSGAWLVCRSAEALACQSVEPIRVAPSAVVGVPDALWRSLPRLEMAAGGRLALVADLSYAVGAVFLLAPETGGQLDTAEVTAGGGIHYVDLGALPPGRYVVLAEAELGPPAGGLVEAIEVEVVGS